MPGVVVAVQAREGEAVAREAPLVVLEAMKMQNALTSPIDGIVRRVHVKPGQTVDGEAILVILERPHERPHGRPEASESPPNDTPESEMGRGA
jgi:pyruvate/2-oxoglutarate dehydrogenase complex dihydrolipoamide acyltransferase (E2) component